MIFQYHLSFRIKHIRVNTNTSLNLHFALKILLHKPYIGNSIRNVTIAKISLESSNSTLVIITILHCSLSKYCSPQSKVFERKLSSMVIHQKQERAKEYNDVNNA